MIHANIAKNSTHFLRLLNKNGATDDDDVDEIPQIWNEREWETNVVIAHEW